MLDYNAPQVGGGKRLPGALNRNNRCGAALAKSRKGFWMLIDVYYRSHQEHKKSANPHQAAESSVEISRSGDRSPAHRPSWSRHLAVSNGR